MAVFTEQQRKLTGKLITSLTGFSAPEENYKLCFQFCKSNFQYHRFLDVNDMQINRSISGLVEKFHIHSQPQKADCLQQLTDQFLSSCLKRSHPRSDAHYGTLSLLLALSHSPLHATYEPATPTLPAEEEEEEFDWASYLMEGIEYSPQQSSGSEWSDSDSERGGATHSYHHSDDHSPHKGHEDLTDEGIGTELCQESESWLTTYLSSPYWDSRQQSVLQSGMAPLPAPSAHSSCHLARKWSAHVVNSDPFSRPVEAVHLSEAQVVRETIWLLLGAEATYVYRLDNDTITVRSDICISHLTPLALMSILAHFAGMGTWLHRMRRFCGVVLKGGGGEYPRCRTYEAFASGLHGCLDQILSSVRTLEAQMVKKEKTVTLLMLAEACHVTFELVNRLYELFHQGIVSTLRDSPGPSNLSSGMPDSRKCSSQLLDCLWVGLEHFDLLGETGEEMLNILYPLWAKTICPYMEMLDSWMTCGIIRDTFNEFCVIRNPGLEIRSPNYWEECFTLAPGATPIFLLPVATEILLAGKSMNVIESIGKLKHIQEGVVHSSPSKGGVISPVPSDRDIFIAQTPPTTLYQDFLRSMLDIVSSSRRVDLVESRDQSCDHPAEEAGWEVKGLDHYDPLMNAYLDQIKADATPSHQKGEEGEVKLPKFCLIPLNLLIQDHLNPLLQHHYRTASGALVDMLRSEFDLLAHVRVVQQYFLMEAGPVMHHFTHELFQNFLDGEDWEDPSYLNAVFEEAIQTCWGSHDDGNRLEKWISVTSSLPGAPPPALADSETTRPLPLSLFLWYTPPWPLDVLFSQEVLGTYNRLFQLLLALRWTKWNLEGVTTRLNTLEAFQGDAALKLHLLFLLRSQLLHFVNSFCSYIMARVLHSVGVELQHNIAMAIDLDSILNLHSTYLDTICDRCFLNQKASMVYKAIETVLKLGVRFRQCWEKGVVDFGVQEAEEIEAEFSQCCRFIVSCLKKTVRQGSHPHLESLAFSLQPLKKAKKIFAPNTVSTLLNS